MKKYIYTANNVANNFALQKVFRKIEDRQFIESIAFEI